jgi:hypothetical protein
MIDDETGEIVYEIMNSPEEVKKTGVLSRLALRSEVSDDLIVSGKAKPFKTAFGAMDEGRLQSMYALMASA